MNIFIVQDIYNHAIKVCSTLDLAFQFCIDNNFTYDYAELNGVLEIELDGETWGMWHSFEEIDQD